MNEYFNVENLAVGYNGKPLINKIDFTIKQGEIVSLIGPNGAGKSTILKTITKHIAPINGVVTLENISCFSMNGREMAKKMAVVLTDRVHPELMTCGELVALGRYPYTNYFGKLTKEDEDEVARALAMVHATDLFDKDFNHISDGQKQRILLARALCQRPKVLVLDEPTSYLDIRHKLDLLTILQKLARDEKITVLMSLHEIDLASKVSDMIVCINGNEILWHGTPEEMFQKDKICKLYNISNGDYDPMFGSVELAKPDGRARILVIGGNGSGIEWYRKLQKKNIAFYAGVLFENDIDFRVASMLANKVISQTAFSSLEEKRQEAFAILDEVDYVFDCGCVHGELDKVNADLLEKARKDGKIRTWMQIAQEL